MELPYDIPDFFVEIKFITKEKNTAKCAHSAKRQIKKKRRKKRIINRGFLRQTKLSKIGCD